MPCKPSPVSSSPPASDVRTTPGWVRPIVLAVLLATAGYFGLCYRFALNKDRPDGGWTHWQAYGLWFGGWQMFTTRDRNHAVLEAVGLVDGAWVPIDLEGLFPARWESGYRFDRSSFRRSRSRMAVLAAATCGRMAAHPDLTEPSQLKFFEIKWRKTLGSAEQPRTKVVVNREVMDWRCGRPVNLPNGRRI